MSVARAVNVETYVDLDRRTLHAGSARISERREVTTVFDYDPAFQAGSRSFSISPDLDLSQSRHVVPLPGAFQDAAPDRWGRNLIERRIRGDARAAGRTPPTVLETDYLLGVSDSTRQGALRFTTDLAGAFLANEVTHSDVPPLVELPRLLSAADSVAADQPGSLVAVKQLLDAGSATLGGARPKASVLDDDRLLIAKFPHHGDDWDVMGWEKTLLDLADTVGIDVPVRRLVTIDGRHVLLIERFDRRQVRAMTERVPYVSAMTLIGATDRRPVDYLEIAEALAAQGSRVRLDLRELFRRIAFTVVVNNADDHSRNHGFLREPGGWRLSPVFDVNPEPDVERAHATSIGFVDDPSRGLDALRSIAADFRLSASAADDIIAEVVEGTRSWRDVAGGNGVPEREVERFAPALDRFR